MSKNYYAILEIPRNASQADIKKSYHRLSLKWHPDKFNQPGHLAKTKAEAEEKFKEINDAYLVLSDVKKRNLYDFNPSAFENYGGSSYNDYDDDYQRERSQAEDEGFREQEINLTKAKFCYCWISPSLGYDLENPPLDPSLWFPYSTWMEKMRKCRYEEVSVFVDELWAAAEEFSRKEKEKRERRNDESLREIEKNGKFRLAIDKEIYKKMYQEESRVFEQELSSNLWSPYKSLSDKVGSIEVNQLEAFKNQVFAAINQVREKKRQANLNHIFEEAKHKTGPDLDEAINNVEQTQGSQAYEESKEKLKEMKKKAAENPEEYRQEAQNRVKECMTKNEVNEQDLNDNKKIQQALNKLNNSETKEPSIIVEVEMTIIDEVWKTGVTKKLNQIITKIQQALKTGSKKDIEVVKTKLLEFINNSHVHYRLVYNKREPEVKSLLNKLENYPTSRQPTSDNKFPLKVLLPIIAASFLIIGLVLLILRQKRLKKVRNKNKKY